MATTYNNLVNKAGTIYDTTTSKGYATPQELATDLGVKTVDFGRITRNDNFNPNVINSTVLAPVQQPQIPEVKPDTTNYSGTILGITDQIANDYKAANEKYNQQLEKQQTGADNITQMIEQLSGRAADTATANEAAGVNTEVANLNKYAQQLADLNAQTSSLSREAQAIPIQVQEANANTGATDRGVAPQTAEALRKNALRALSIGQQADIAAAAATGSKLRLDAAMEKAKLQVDLKYKPIEDRLAAEKERYMLNKDLLDTLDKKRSEALKLAIDRDERQIADKKEKEKDIQGIALRASQFGAPPEVVANISKSTSLLEAINSAGKYTADPLEKMLKQEQILNNQTERAYKKAQISKIAAEIKESQAPLAIPTVAGSVNDLSVQLLNTSKYKENLSATEREKISKAMTVIGQLSDLQTNIAKQNKTGFFKGKVNELMASFGKNADAGVIMAQLQAVVPNLARGTYGEVGVLTDSDIANYRKTLPNLTSPKEQNEAVLALTLKTVKKSIENTLKTAAASKLDVSGFVSSYGEITKEIGQIENRLGVSKLKVNELMRNNPTLSPLIRDIYKRGASDFEVLEALGAN